MGRVPAAAALRGGDVVRVQSVRDRGQALSGFSLAPDPRDPHERMQCDGAASYPGIHAEPTLKPLLRTSALTQEQARQNLPQCLL